MKNFLLTSQINLLNDNQFFKYKLSVKYELSKTNCTLVRQYTCDICVRYIMTIQHLKIYAFILLKSLLIKLLLFIQCSTFYVEWQDCKVLTTPEQTASLEEKLFTAFLLIISLKLEERVQKIHCILV